MFNLLRVKEGYSSVFIYCKILELEYEQSVMVWLWWYLTKWMGKREEEEKDWTNGASDEEAGMGVKEKWRRRVVVKPREADHARVLFPRTHLLTPLSLFFFFFAAFIFIHSCGCGCGCGCGRHSLPLLSTLQNLLFLDCFTPLPFIHSLLKMGWVYTQTQQYHIPISWNWCINQ